MTRALPRIAGVGLAALVFVAALVWGFGARLEARLVEALQGPGGVVAEHRQGTTGGATIDLVRLVGGGRSVEVLRAEGAEGVGLRWDSAQSLTLCLGAADVLSAAASASLGGQAVSVHLAPLPAPDCAR